MHRFLGDGVAVMPLFYPTFFLVISTSIYGVIIRNPEDTLLLLLKRFYDLI
jgi:hypothetical protein